MLGCVIELNLNYNHSEWNLRRVVNHEVGH